MNIGITKIHPQAVIPSYATPGSAAFDLTTVEDIAIEAKGKGAVSTGLVFHLPADHVLHIFARSSTFNKLGLILSNGVGVIDADYSGPQDELKILFYNPGDTNVTVVAGTRVAQGIIYPRPRIEFIEEETKTTSRGGFGSTGGYLS